MKIIGNCGDGKFILEATDIEIARVLGAPYVTQRMQREEIRVGATIPVNDWWDFVTTLKRKEEEVRKTGETLRSIAELVTKAWPSITNMADAESGKNIQPAAKSQGESA